jgi:hypothetical protein
MKVSTEAFQQTGCIRRDIPSLSALYGRGWWDRSAVVDKNRAQIGSVQNLGETRDLIRVITGFLKR